MVSNINLAWTNSHCTYDFNIVMQWFLFFFTYYNVYCEKCCNYKITFYEQFNQFKSGFLKKKKKPQTADVTHQSQRVTVIRVNEYKTSWAGQIKSDVGLNSTKYLHREVGCLSAHAEPLQWAGHATYSTIPKTPQRVNWFHHVRTLLVEHNHIHSLKA